MNEISRAEECVCDHQEGILCLSQLLMIGAMSLPLRCHLMTGFWINEHASVLQFLHLHYENGTKPNAIPSFVFTEAHPHLMLKILYLSKIEDIPPSSCTSSFFTRLHKNLFIASGLCVSLPICLSSLSQLQ